MPQKRPIYVVVPFYKNPDLIGPLFTSLQQCASEFKGLDCTLVAINDSPGEPELTTALRGAIDELSANLSCVLLQNPETLGFIRSTNRGLRMAVENSADVVLLNSDTVVYPGAISELQRVAYLDYMIGFVSPRSNNATICSFPHQEEFRSLRPSESYAIFQELSPYLPIFHYVPTAVGFCMFIKSDILKEFGLFDEEYGKGYNEENDLVMRANRCGYRAALANRAFVYHIGERSFAVSDTPKTAHEERNAFRLNSRYPEFSEQVRTYFDDVHYQAEVLIRGLLKDGRGRYDIVFDFSSFGTHHNGTFEAAKQILIHAAASWRETFNIYVLVDPEAARFHQLHRIQGIFLLTSKSTRVFAIAFRFGQPFEYEVIARMSQLAVFNVYSMLDTIAWDCLYLNRPDLDEIWRAVFCHADAVTYISDFVADQFHLRFARRAGLKEMVSYLSLDTQDFVEEIHGATSEGNYLLVIGNAFAHKNVLPTVRALAREFPREKIVALGLQESVSQNVIGYASGQLSEEELQGLFINARAVIFPSLYEGFGIPIVRGLAYRKPMLARSMPVNLALFEKLGKPADLILYSSTEELISRLRSGVPAWKHSVPSLRGQYDWATSTAEIGRFLQTLPETISFGDVLVPRLNYIRLLRKAELQPPLFSPEPSTLDQSNLIHANNVDGSADGYLRQIHELQGQVAVSKTIIRDREQRIEGLLSSVSWRITAPLRAAADLWIKLTGASGHQNGGKPAG